MRKITVSSDKHKFGVQLRAEPDNQVLGRRLKGAFKQVSQAIKGMLHLKKQKHFCTNMHLDCFRCNVVCLFYVVLCLTVEVLCRSFRPGNTGF